MTVRVPDHIARLMTYIPGESEESVQTRQDFASPLKLASNENPLGPSPRALEAARTELQRSHRYPEGSGRNLREALGLHLQVPKERILLGNGSTELVELLVRTFLGRAGNAVIPEQTFIMYRIAVLAVDGRVRQVPLRDMRIDLAGIASACDAETNLVFLANPNNPTGTYFTAAELEQYFRSVPEKVITVLDEAYCEYLSRPDYPSGLDCLRQGRQVVILRTFSKAHGLAGLRVGYAIGHEFLVAALEKIRSPFNTNRIAQAAALAALEDIAHLQLSVEANRLGIEFLSGELAARGVRLTPSVANFLLVHFDRSGESVYRDLLCDGIITRPMSAYGFPRSLRISIGTQPQLERLLRSLDRVLSSPPSGSS